MTFVKGYSGTALPSDWGLEGDFGSAVLHREITAVYRIGVQNKITAFAVTLNRRHCPESQPRSQNVACLLAALHLQSECTLIFCSGEAAGRY